MSEPIPWHLIAKQWRNGSSIESLCARFHVQPAELKKRLATAYDSERLDIRTNAEIKAISDHVKSDLVTALARMSQALAEKDDLSLRDAPALDRLITSAARLFAWPSAKPIDQANPALLASSQGAINLALIRTSPDQLKALSDLNRAMLSNSPPADPHANALPESKPVE